MNTKRTLIIKEIALNPPVYVLTGVPYMCTSDEVLREVTRWISVNADTGENTIDSADWSPLDYSPASPDYSPTSPDYSPTSPDCEPQFPAIPTASIIPFVQVCSRPVVIPFLSDNSPVNAPSLPGNSPGPELSDGEEWEEGEGQTEREQEEGSEIEAEQRGEVDDIIVVGESETEFEPADTTEVREEPFERESGEAEELEGNTSETEEETHSVWEDISRRIEAATERQNQQLAQQQAQLEEVNSQIRQLKDKKDRTREAVRRRVSLDSEIRERTNELYEVEQKIREKKKWIGPEKGRTLPETDWWPSKLQQGAELTVLWTSEEPQFQVNVRRKQRGRESTSHLLTTRKEIAAQRAIEELCVTLQIDQQLEHDLIDQFHRKDGPKRKRRRKRGRGSVREAVALEPNPAIRFRW